jgi:glycosidase
LKRTNHSRHLAAEPDNTAALEEYRLQYQKKSRDNGRTPVQWTSGPNAGFSDSVKPWMSVHPNYTTVNAAAQVSDPASVFHYWRTVLRVRKEFLDIFVYGDFAMLDRDSEQVWAYTRRSEEQQAALVLCNFTGQTVEWDAAAHKVGRVQEVLLDNYGGGQEKYQGAAWSLQPYAAAVLLLSTQ